MTINKKDLESLQNKETLFEFPCQFPIKIMANPDKKTTQFILGVFEKYVQDYNNIDFKVKESKTGKYISITAIFEAQSKKQLDNIYKSISEHSEVHMVL